MNAYTSFQSIGAAAIVLLSSYIDHASAQSQFTVHAGAGPSNVTINGSGLLDLTDPYIKPITQYYLGVQYTKVLSKRMDVVTGVQYASRGFGAREQFNVDAFGLDLPLGASLSTRFDYLEAPVLIRYNLTGQGVRPYVETGLSAGYALSGSVTPQIHAVLDWNLPEIPLNLNQDIYNRFDLSAMIGTGVEIPLGPNGAFQIEAGYRHSLNDMFQDRITDIRIKSNGFTAGIGYTVRF